MKDPIFWLRWKLAITKWLLAAMKRHSDNSDYVLSVIAEGEEVRRYLQQTLDERSA